MNNPAMHNKSTAYPGENAFLLPSATDPLQNSLKHLPTLEDLRSSIFFFRKKNMEEADSLDEDISKEETPKERPAKDENAQAQDFDKEKQEFPWESISKNQKSDDDLSPEFSQEPPGAPYKSFPKGPYEPLPNRSFFGSSLFTLLLIFVLAVTSVCCFQPSYDYFYKKKSDSLSHENNPFSNGIFFNGIVLSQLYSINEKLIRDGLIQEPGPDTEDLPNHEDNSQSSTKEKNTSVNVQNKTENPFKNDSSGILPEQREPYALQKFGNGNVFHLAQDGRQISIGHPDLYFYITDKEGKAVDQYALQNQYPHPDGSAVYLRFSTNEKSQIQYIDSSIPSYPSSISNLKTRIQRSSLTLLPSARYLFIVPEDYRKIPGGSFTNYADEEFVALVFSIVGIIALIFIALTFLLALFLPWHLQKSATFLRLFIESWLELKVLIFILPIVLNLSPLTEGSHSTRRFFANFMDISVTPAKATLVFYAFGIFCAFIGLMLIYLFGVYLKYIVYTGFVQGFIKNSLIGKLFCKLFSWIKGSTSNFATSIHRRSRLNLLMILLASSFALFLCVSDRNFTPFDLLLVAAFFFASYKIIGDHLSNIAKLENYSEKMAAGDFDFITDQKMGPLQTTANHMNHIRSGFQKAVEKEMQSQAMKTQLITNVSHDLKTPLTSIINYADLLKQNHLSEGTRKEYIDIIYKKSQRLNILIQDLFDASKASSGNIELHMEKINILSLFYQSLGEMEEKFTEKGLTVKLRLSGSSLTIFSQDPASAPDTSTESTDENHQVSSQKLMCTLDGRQTSRVFENILCNIVKYALTSSRVYVDIVSKNGYCAFIFKNISNYEMNFDTNEITERFTRGDMARSTEGSGLGLSIAKSLTELQGGHLEIHVDGDLFKLTLAFPQDQ